MAWGLPAGPGYHRESVTDGRMSAAGAYWGVLRSYNVCMCTPPHVDMRQHKLPQCVCNGSRSS
jgi:hypothetical protein